MVFVSQGFDTDAPQTQTLVTVHGLVDSLYLEELAKKTFRGVEQLAISGLHTGGRVFGYRRVLIESKDNVDSHGRPAILGVKLEVDTEQAATIRRIFRRYAAGHSMKRIAIDLNDDGIASPQPQKGRVARSWCPSSVHHILHNERYRGVVTWGRTKKVRSPETGKRVYHRKPESEWRRMQLQDQRIISDELWNRVRERMQIARQLYGIETLAGERRKRSGRAAGSPHIFTGLLACSQCGGSVTIVSGGWKRRVGDGWKTRGERYGCSMHAYRGNSACTNALLVDKSLLETRLLAGLQAKVLHPAVIEYTLRRFGEELERIAKREEDSGLVRRKVAIEKQIANCTEAIAGGQVLRSLTEKIASLERELAEVNAKLSAAKPLSVRTQMRDTRRFVKERLKNLVVTLNREPRMAREAMAKHVTKITLTAEGASYVATGSWDLLGWGIGGRIIWCRGRGSHHGISEPSPVIPFRIEVAA